MHKTVIRYFFSTLGAFTYPLAAVIMTCMLAAGTHADAREDQIKWAGIDLFPSLIAADVNLPSKRGPDGKLLLMLTYIDRRREAEEMLLHLKKIRYIRNIPVRLELIKRGALVNYGGHPPAGIFLTQRMDHHLQSVIDYAIDHGVIVFSPFESDVEKGVLGGIVVRERILPYINTETMRLSGISIKPFFLKISEFYE